MIFFVAIIAIFLIIALSVIILMIVQYRATDKEKIITKDVVKSEEIIDFKLCIEYYTLLLFLYSRKYYLFYTKSGDKLEKHEIEYSGANIKIIEDGSKPRFETTSIKTYNRIVKIPKIWKHLKEYKKYSVGDLILSDEETKDTIYITADMMKNNKK